MELKVLPTLWKHRQPICIQEALKAHLHAVQL